MKKSFIIIVLIFIISQTNTFAQDKAGYQLISFNKDCNPNLSKCSYCPEGQPYIFEDGSDSYNIDSEDSFLDLELKIFSKCCENEYGSGSCSDLVTYYENIEIDLNSIERGKWVYKITSLSHTCLECDGMFNYKYYKRPDNPTNFKLQDGISNIFNEFDTINCSINATYSLLLYRKIESFDWSICDTIFFSGTDFQIELNNLDGITEATNILYKVKTINVNGDNDINKSIDFSEIIPITVYPRRPKIINKSTNKPLCYGAGNGTITIDSINGAIDTLSNTNGSVAEYKIQFFKDKCDTLKQKILDFENDPTSSPPSWLNFNGGTESIKYLKKLPITFQASDFPTESGEQLKSGNYCIQLENSYRNTNGGEDSTLRVNNGRVFTDIIIHEKASLYIDTSSTHLTCNNNNTGKIKLSVGGGNPQYNAYLYYNNSTIKIDSILNIGQQGGQNKSETKYFNGLSAGTYKIQLVDKNNCKVFVETNEQDSNFVKDILVKEPDVLEISNFNKTDIACNGDNSGLITFNITGGTKNINNNYSYKLFDQPFDLNIYEEGQTNNSNKTINNLPPNNLYSLLITDDNNCEVRSNPRYFNITEPDALLIDTIIKSNYNGKEIKCHGDNNGKISVIETGGTSPYFYTLYDQGGVTESNTSGIFELLYKGEYDIEIKDKNDCIVIAGGSTVLQEPDELELTLPTISDYNGVNISCTGYSDGWINISSTGGTGEKRFSIENNKNNGGPGPNPSPSHTFDNLSVGDKKITVTDVNNCTYTKTYKLTQPETLPKIDSINLSDYNGFFVHCKGDNDGKITIKPQKKSGTPFSNANPYLYSIYDGEVFRNIPNFDSLTYKNDYKLKIKDANNCQSTTYNVNIEEPSEIKVQASSPQQGNENSPYNISCNGYNDGEINLSASGGVESTYKYFYSKNGNTFQPVGNHLTNQRAGNYFYFSKDTNNCVSVTKKIALIEPSSLTLRYDTSNYIGNHAIRCHGLNDTITIFPTGGFGANEENGFYKVNFGSANINTINYDEQDKFAKFVINASDDYTIKITDANNCIFDYPHILQFSQPDEMFVNLLEIEPTLCHNSTDGKLNIKWQGGSENYTYYLKKGNNFIDTLYNNNTNNTSTFNGLDADTYRIKVIDENNCEDLSETRQLISPDEIIVEETITEQPICFGDTLGSFNLSGTGGTASNNIFNFYIKTSYGDSIFIPDTNLASFNNVKLGTHKFFAIDDNNCISLADSLKIEAPSELIANTSFINVSAQGGTNGSASVELAGGTPGYTYLWTDENNNIIGDEDYIDGYPAGNYTVEMWDANDCPFHDSENGLIKNITIHEPNFALELIIEQVHNVSFPGTNDGSVSLNSNGGWGQNLYKKGQFGTYSAVKDYSNLSAGTYWFYVKDSYNIVDSAQVIITETPPMQITNSNITNINCFGENNGEANFTVSGGTLPYLYSLNNIDFSENNYFKNLSPDSYTVYIKDARDYEISQDFTISQPTEALSLNITNNQNTSCGASDGLATVLAQGGTLPYQYYWEEIGLYNATASGLSAGTYNATVTDENLCTASVQIIINNSDGPVIGDITTTDTKCFNTTDGTANISNISASTLYTIQWSNGQVGNMMAENLASGNYTVQVTDENDCSAIEAFTINSPEDLHFSFNTTNPICYDACNGNITANLSGGTTPYILEWENISGNPSTNHVSDLCANNYILNVTDAHNCEYSSTAILENPEQIIILEENQATICQGQEITLDAGNEGSSYSWTGDNFQSYEQSVTLNEAGTYYVNLVTPQGCTAQDEFTLNFSSDYLQANFLMQSEAEIADTVVLVEISWEVPDSVSWYFPQELWVLSQTEENVQLIPTQSGTFTVGLTAHLGTCSDFLEKQITITGTPDKGLTQEKYFSDDAKQFKSVNLHPNPNNGIFTLDISLYEENDVLIEVYDLLGQKQQTHKIGKGEKKYTFEFNINNLKQGLYFISIKTDKGTAGLKFLKQ